MARRWATHRTIAAGYSTLPWANRRSKRQSDRRDRAMLAVLAYCGCRVGGLVRLKVRDYKTSDEHRILNITGKERTASLHLEAVERLAEWLAVPLLPRAATFQD